MSQSEDCVYPGNKSLSAGMGMVAGEHLMLKRVESEPNCCASWHLQGCEGQGAVHAAAPAAQPASHSLPHPAPNHLCPRCHFAASGVNWKSGKDVTVKVLKKKPKPGG